MSAVQVERHRSGANASAQPRYIGQGQGHGGKASGDKAATFLRSKRGAHHCPKGSRHVLNLAECRAAGISVGAQDCTDFRDGHYGPHKAIGCAINVHKNCFHFNLDNLNPLVPVAPPMFVQHVCAKLVQKEAVVQKAPMQEVRRPPERPSVAAGLDGNHVNSSGSPIPMDPMGYLTRNLLSSMVGVLDEEPDAGAAYPVLEQPSIFFRGSNLSYRMRLWNAIVGSRNAMAFAIGLGLLLFMICGITTCWGEVEKLSSRTK